MRSLQEINGWINLNSQRIIDGINQRDISTYLFIKHEFENGQIINNIGFKKNFKNFYRLNAAFPTDNFYVNYFEKFDLLRDTIITEELFTNLLNEWHGIPNRRGLNRVEFSFLSKMLHTIDNTQPIYDSKVRFVFLFEYRPNWTTQQKISNYYHQYQILKDSYDSIIANGSLNDVLLNLNNQRERIGEMSEIKKLDFIFWTAGKIWEIES